MNTPELGESDREERSRRVGEAAAPERRPHEVDRRGRGVLVFRRASSPQDLERVFRFRYQVYVVERAFERAEDHPGGVERDPFDAVAAHFLCETRDGLPIGTLRLIPPSPLGFPLEKHCSLSIDPAQLARGCLGEISRLALTRQYQRRRDDAFNPARLDDSDVSGVAAPGDRRRDDLVLGLYREMYRATKELGITHWYAAMEDKLHILLRRMGLDFQPIGPYVDYHGRRAPFLAEVAAIERIWRDRFPDLHRHFTEGL